MCSESCPQGFEGFLPKMRELFVKNYDEIELKLDSFREWDDGTQYPVTFGDRSPQGFFVRYACRHVAEELEPIHADCGV